MQSPLCRCSHWQNKQQQAGGRVREYEPCTGGQAGDSVPAEGTPGKGLVWERPGVAQLQALVQDVAKEDFLLH